MAKGLSRSDFVIKDLAISLGGGGGSGTWLPGPDGETPPSPISPIASIVVNISLIEGVRQTIQRVAVLADQSQSIRVALLQNPLDFRVVSGGDPWFWNTGFHAGDRVVGVVGREYDKVVSIGTLEHAGRDQLAEVVRAHAAFLKPGGLGMRDPGRQRPRRERQSRAVVCGGREPKCSSGQASTG